MDHDAHKRFLDYRERHGYFAVAGQPKLDAREFAAADAEWASLHDMGEARDDEEEERYAALTKLLFRD